MFIFKSIYLDFNKEVDNFSGVEIIHYKFFQQLFVYQNMFHTFAIPNFGVFFECLYN